MAIRCRTRFGNLRGRDVVILIDGRSQTRTIRRVLANCPSCGHPLLLVTMYRRGARRACDRCENFSEFDGEKLVALREDAPAARPPIKAGIAEARPGMPSSVRRAAS
jgi:hypothetical protein